MLRKILRKKNFIAIGMNSGTSADGLDLAAVRINMSEPRAKVKFIGGKTIPYPKRLYDGINDAVCRGLKSIDTYVQLDRTLGEFYARQARLFIDFLKKKKMRTDIIASHGQTVRHLPGRIKIGRKAQSGTLQIGHPESIANQAGIITVADFRQGDIAAGGEGAPVTGHAMWHLFSSASENRMLLNIGGIANYFLFPKGKPPERMQAADCGPGNSLIDILVMKHFGKKYDRGGGLASKGKISKRLLSILLADNFLKKKYGPSTGRERFGHKFADKINSYSVELGLNRYDILATTAELTAVSIANTVKDHIKNFHLKRIYIFGGGASNKFLVSRMKVNLPGVEFFSVDRLGVNPDYLEAVCYAVMGAMAVGGKTSSLAHVTGAAYNTVAGRIVQPSGKRK